MQGPTTSGALNSCYDSNFSRGYSKLADDDPRLAVEAMERKRNRNQNGGKVIFSGGRLEIMKMLLPWLKNPPGG